MYWSAWPSPVPSVLLPVELVYLTVWFLFATASPSSAQYIFVTSMTCLLAFVTKFWCDFLVDRSRSYNLINVPGFTFNLHADDWFYSYVLQCCPVILAYWGCILYCSYAKYARFYLSSNLHHLPGWPWCFLCSSLNLISYFGFVRNALLWGITTMLNQNNIK